jgi:hypothetical protein
MDRVLFRDEFTEFRRDAGEELVRQLTWRPGR